MPSTYVVAADPSVRVHLMDLGLACCGVEFAAAVTQGLLAEARADAPDPRIHLLVVSGTLTDVLAPAVLAAWERLPEPRAVMSFGACASTGGPYWDSYSVTKGVDQLVPVAVYVPGCPPRPEAVLAAVAELEVSG